jgi:diacylglycerol kinase
MPPDSLRMEQRHFQARIAASIVVASRVGIAMQGRIQHDHEHADDEPGGFSLSARARSFVYAGRGIGILIRSQHNAWIHALATMVVCGLGLFLRLSALEWCAILIAILIVWVSEALNTAIELLADVVSPKLHPLIGQAKDVAAGAVLIAAMCATGIGILVLGPHLLVALG